MATIIDIVLVADRYDAGAGHDPKRDEWPPHPARVVSALLSVVDEATELEALRKVETLPAPVVRAAPPDLVTRAHSRAYVVTNTVSPGGGNLTHLGRTSGLRERRSTFPASPRVQMVWPDVGDDDLTALDRLARRVPYLGRSTSVVLMGVRRADDDSLPTGLTAYRPCARADADTWLRCPYPGYLDELSALHDAGLSAWQAGDNGESLRPYRCGIGGDSSTDAPREVVRSPYEDVVVLRFQNQRPDGRLAVRYTSALRSMVMSKTGDPLPPAVHGHGLDGRPHVAYLALPATGHEHSDGHLLGLGVAIPGMTQTERRRILRGLLGSTDNEFVTLGVPGLGDVTLRYAPADPRPLAATARWWTRPSLSWVSVTPVVLDRFPKDGDAAAQVMRDVVQAGLPEPREVEVSTQPMTPGGIRMLPRDLPHKQRGRLYRHARLTFDQPVTGPVLVGAARYAGLGLFAPERVDASQRQEVRDDSGALD